MLRSVRATFQFSGLMPSGSDFNRIPGLLILHVREAWRGCGCVCVNTCEACVVAVDELQCVQCACNLLADSRPEFTSPFVPIADLVPFPAGSFHFRCSMPFVA